MTIKYLVTLSALLLLTACVMTPSNPPVSSNVNAGTQAAEVKLAEAAASVSQSLQQLTDIEKASHPDIQMPPPPNASSIGMGRLASVTWNGPIEPLVRKIAAVTGYRVRVLGRKPAIVPLVSISAQNTPLADILRDASFQVAKKVDIVAYPRSRVIELRYLTP